MRRLHEDPYDRNVIIIDVKPTAGGRDIIKIVGDEVTSERGGKGRNAWSWDTEGYETQYGTPWTVFMDDLISHLEDAGYEPEVLGDTYGSLGKSSIARRREDDFSPWAQRDSAGNVEFDDSKSPIHGDLYPHEVEINALPGNGPLEKAQTLMAEIQDAMGPEGFQPSMDGEGTIYISMTMDDSLDHAEIAANKREVDRERMLAPQEAGRLSEPDATPPPVGSLSSFQADDFDEMGGPEDPDVQDIPLDAHHDADEDDTWVEARDMLYTHPDVYASALLMSGFSPESVVRILAASGLHSTLSSDQMSEVRTFRTAVVSESLVPLVESASRHMGAIDRSGYLREDLAERYRRVLFTKAFAREAAKDQRVVESLRDHSTLRRSIVKHLVNNIPDDVLDGPISEQEAVMIAKGLDNRELEQIAQNIRIVGGARGDLSV